MTIIEQHYHIKEGEPPKLVFLPPPCQCIFDGVRQIVREELAALLAEQGRNQEQAAK